MQPFALLGPQRLSPTLAEAVAALELAGPLTLIAAGAEERESDDAYVVDQLPGRQIDNLELFDRGLALLDAVPRLKALTRARQERLRKQQALYRRRLDHALDAYRDLARLLSDDDLLAAESESALDAVRELDRYYLDRVSAIWADYRVAEAEVEAGLAAVRSEMAERVEGSAGVLIAGGHVGTLLNALRLFDLKAALGTRPIVAWSAGAMAISDRVVLFHDSPPWGAGNAEALARGEGLAGGILALPSARHRLRLDRQDRVGSFAGRFAPTMCIGLDDGSQVIWREGRWSARSILRLRVDGRVLPVGAEGWEELVP